MSRDTQAILDEREKTYGAYSMQSQISQSIKWVLRKHDAKLLPYQREALDMIANKIGRILNGNPNYIDSWDDIAGYAKLVVNELTKKPDPEIKPGAIHYRPGTPEDGGHHARFTEQTSSCSGDTR